MINLFIYWLKVNKIKKRWVAIDDLNLSPWFKHYNYPGYRHVSVDGDFGYGGKLRNKVDEIIKILMEYVTDEIVVCNIGIPSKELFKINDREKNFYMLGSMGLSSSIGHGLALSVNEKIVIFAKSQKHLAS